MRIEEAREDFPVFKQKTYLDTATYSPASTPVLNAVWEWWETRKLIPNPNALDQYSLWNKRAEKGREEAARLLNARVEEIAFIPTTTFGINMAATMIDWRRGDNVVINDLEHPANTLPWMHLSRKGVNVKVARNVDGRIAISDLEQLIDKNTRVVAFSSVSFSNGFRIDLEALVRLAEDHGAYVVVDAIQSLGALELDVRKTGVHFLAAHGLKWLCAPFGSGILYCKRGLVEEFVPELVGTENLDVPDGFLIGSVRDPSEDTIGIYDQGLARTAKRFQYSASDLPALWGLAAALKYLNEIGIRNIESRVLKLSDYLVDELQRIGARVISPLEDKHRSGIVTYAGDLRTLKVLNNEGVAVDLRYAGGQGGIRVSTHFYNNEDDVDKLIAIQKRIA